MGIHISLRTESDISFFKRYINGILDINEAKTVLISSGYYNSTVTSDIFNLIQHSNIEKVKLFGGKNYPSYFREFFKSKDENPSLASYKEKPFSYYRILHNKTLNIVQKIKDSKISEVKKLENDVRNDLNFLEFFGLLNSLSSSKKGFSAELRLFTTINSNWHAKIMIILDKDNIPLAGIIGSSNLTKPPYEEKIGYFNYESDVVLYNPVYESNFESIRNSIVNETMNDIW